ncbi:3-methyladenine DNA glycosylase AlkD [Arthrobacter sp. UYCu511]|uniref:DNA alkylation repair protein n=1 Tax=Arthrobacter sp. UYCu511 TaxID=3156337 RepID=UPI00339A7F5E
MEQLTAEQLLQELAALENPKARAINESRGDDHGVNLGTLRTIAKALKTQPELSRELWQTGNTAARLLALLICRPKAFTVKELETMVREASVPKVNDWFINYVVKKSVHTEELRQAWFADPDPIVAASGWALTSELIVKKPDGLNLPELLEIIEVQMKTAPSRLQWAMNTALAQIGIENPELRERALAIGERLEVLKDYPTPPNCTSPYAPIWITEIVARQEAARKETVTP